MFFEINVSAGKEIHHYRRKAVLLSCNISVGHHSKRHTQYNNLISEQRVVGHIYPVIQGDSDQYRVAVDYIDDRATFATDDQHKMFSSNMIISNIEYEI